MKMAIVWIVLFLLGLLLVLAITQPTASETDAGPLRVLVSVA